MPSPTDEKLSLPMKKYWRGEYFVCLCHCGFYCWGCGGISVKKYESVTFLVLTKVSGQLVYVVRGRKVRRLRLVVEKGLGFFDMCF